VVNRVELEIGGGGVAVIRLGSPDGMNSLGIAEIARLIEIVDRVAGDDAIRALVLSGEENFSAGTDFQQSMLHRLDPEAGGLAYRFLTDQKTVCDRIRGLRIPTLSLVRGLCAGSALGIAAAADFLITDTTTRIRLPEVKVGLIPGNGATWFLPRRMGPAVAKYYGLTAAPMSGKQAVALGLALPGRGSGAFGKDRPPLRVREGQSGLPGGHFRRPGAGRGARGSLRAGITGLDAIGLGPGGVADRVPHRHVRPGRSL